MNLAEIIRAAIEIGERTGFVTFDQLNELIPSTEAEPVDIETILAALSASDIRIAE